ncbi:type II secretion system F family protein [Patescibacteria group bacterium]|nr:type II secretion system F family protein [Patescibacteria group bacterium]MBU4162304.1 type II secretion system F family protein [Patescibacteria group bacterium]
MSVYSYTAKSFSGKSKKGTVEAKSKKELASMLKQDGFFLISAEAGKAPNKKIKISLGIKYVSLTEKLMATRNLQVMIAAGVPLPRSLEILSTQAKNKYFKKVLANIKNEIIKGTTLSDALKKYPRVFPEIYYSMVQVGEQTGKMEEVLDILAIQLERAHELKSKVIGAMVYPAVIIAAMLVIGVIMLVKVVPQLSKTFEELGVDLPPMTLLVIGLGNFLVNRWYIVILILLVLVFAIIILIRNKTGKKYFDAWLLRIPVISGLIKKINCAYTSITLSALIQGGVPIVTALGISVGAVSNTHFKDALKDAAKKVQKGERLSSAMSKFPNLYPNLFLQMLQVGEETGETSGMLSKLANFFEGQVNNITKNLSSIIEPVLLLFVGAVVAFFAIAMVQPIYSIMSGM